MMKEVKLNMDAQKKYETIKALVDTNGNRKRAATNLSLTVQHIGRLIKIYKECGKAGFIHGNTNRKPKNALPQTLLNTIILLYRNKYQGFNFKHFHEYLEEEEEIKVSYSAVYKALRGANIYSPKIRKATKKRLKKEQLEKQKLLKNKTNEEIEKIINHEIALEDSHPRREKPKYFGEITEMDGSFHLWFGDKKACLHLAADRCTNTIVGAYFDWQETLFGYYNVFKQILENYGIPSKFVTDNRTVFAYRSLSENNRTSEKNVLTQFGYACKQLGVSIETTSVPQAKGLIERDNGTFQGRLVNELRLNNITTIEDANKYLTEVFVPKFNSKFALNYKKFKSVYEKSPSEKQINYTLAVLSIRTIDNGNSLKYKYEYYQPYSNNRLVCFKPKTECLVIKALDGQLLATIDDKIYELRKLNLHEKYSKEFDTIPKEKKKRKKYIPPMNHPWRISCFKKHLNNSEHSVYA